MYKLKVRKDKKCTCGAICKLYSPKGYKNVTCKCFLCQDCWIANESERCPTCNDEISKWKKDIMRIDECTLCLLNKKMVKSPCDHTFCIECWNESGKRKAECPHCRYNLTKWMKKLNIDIGSEKLYDEENLPTMDLSDDENEMQYLDFMSQLSLLLSGSRNISVVMMSRREIDSDEEGEYISLPTSIRRRVNFHS